MCAVILCLLPLQLFHPHIRQLITSADSKRSALLIACQTAYYNGSTVDSAVLNEDGSLADITCITATGNQSYLDAECQTRYSGVLCTNCADGYGNSR